MELEGGLCNAFLVFPNFSVFSSFFSIFIHMELINF